MKHKFLLFLCFFIGIAAIANNPREKPFSITGKVTSLGKGIEFATVTIRGTDKRILCDKNGNFQIDRLTEGNYTIEITAAGYFPYQKQITVSGAENINLTITLTPIENTLDQVVVSGTLKPVAVSASPVQVEIFTPQFFRKNPTPGLFDALQNVNGVRPQLNCNICNTGDIHINGLEGPYTMITIDGMPIVSSLSTVYGLSGIPNALIERVEIVKGPASSLYGSEAVGGLINIITKSPGKAAAFNADIFTNIYGEHSIDVGGKWRMGKSATVLSGLQLFNYSNPVDHNKDQFTDVTLQKRISLFNKIAWYRKENKVANIAARYFYEDRWGGDMRWNKTWRGTDSIYGESIYTSRVELLGKYDLPGKENISLSASYNYHHQNSYYGTVAFMAKQHIAFAQLTWDKTISKNWTLLSGIATRYNFYDDNTTATIDTNQQINKPDNIILPGIFIQNEWKLNTNQLLLAGLRYDYDQRHGNIVTPRIAWKLTLPNTDIIRLNAGTGFRVVNLFTEDHAALTGARQVVIAAKLKPEQSYNFNMNYAKKMRWGNTFVGIDIAAWYTYFTNQIIPDYITNVNQIIYNNLDGNAVSKGITINTDWSFGHRLKLLAGITMMDVYKREINKSTGLTERTRPLLTEKITGTWSLSYTFNHNISIDYTGNFYGAMLLPVLGELDPRKKESPLWSIQNIQATKKWANKIELYGGVKNLLNWTPNKGNPFIIARSHDPFDKQVEFDTNGGVIATPSNPNALTFDPNYVYGPNQGIRLFLGFRYTFQ